MAETKKSVFDVLNAINVNEHTEVKDTGSTKLTYLSWAWAWAEVKKKFPDATYEIVKFDGIPYVYDPLTGFMVYTTVTIGGITHEMWLPVMDGNNRAMKAEAYQIQTKYKTISVPPATMFDVNKAIMRCLTKNLAMFGLGLYIYAGEDLPETEDEGTPAPAKKVAKPKAEPTPAPEPAPVKKEVSEESKKIRRELVKYCQENDVDLNRYHLTNDSSDEAFKEALANAKYLVEQREAEGGELPFPL